MKRFMAFSCLFLTISVCGQVSRITLDSLFPDVKVQMIVNDLKKPVVLDFFSSTCSVCFKMLPKLKALQEKYRDKIQFVLVGKEDEQIRKLYRQFEKKWNLSFPVLYDSVLPKKLGVETYPAYVWINGQGITRATTGVSEVKEDYVERFVTEKDAPAVPSPIKKYAFDPAIPFLQNGNGGSDSSLLYQITIANWQSGTPLYLPPSIYYFNSAAKFQVLGASVDELYNYGFFGYRHWNSSDELFGKAWPRVVINPADSISIKLDRTERYSISVSSPRSIVDYNLLQRVIKTGLDNLLGYEASLEMREMPCWTIEATGAAKTKLRSSGGERSVNANYSGVSFVNVPVSALIETLTANNQLEPPFIDKTGFDFNIDLKLDAILFDIHDLQKALAQNGLMLKEEKKMMKVIVLRVRKENVATR